MGAIAYVKDHLFEILVIVILLGSLSLGIYNRFTGKQGTWLKNRVNIDPTRRTRREQGENYNDSNNIDKPVRESRESSGEIECRRALRELFPGRLFNKDRPAFLNNPVTGGKYNLELDCFDPELKIAIEFDGAQHFKYIPFFHKNPEAFNNQKYRDYMKEVMCRDNGVILIRVPHTVKVSDIKAFLIKELRKAGVFK